MVKNAQYHKDVSSLQFIDLTQLQSKLSKSVFGRIWQANYKIKWKRKRTQIGNTLLKKKKYVKEIALLENKIYY